MYTLWSNEEIELLTNNYPVKTKKEMEKLLPNKSSSAIIHKATRLGVSKAFYFWDEDELRILRDNWATKSRPEILELLPNKDWCSVRHKAAGLHLFKIPKAKYWRTYCKINSNVESKNRLDIVSQLKLSDVDRAYLAGIIDGEGTIRIMKTTIGPRFVPFLSISNTSISLMNWLTNIFGNYALGGNIYQKKFKPNDNNKAQYVFNINRSIGVKQILTLIIDCLKIKQEQAKLVLELIQVKENKATYGTVPQEFELYKKCRILNARGLGPVVFS